MKWITTRKKLKDLIEYEHNPRLLNEKQKEDLIKSLKKFSLAEIPAINLDNKIIAGHQRIKILLELEGPEFEIDVRVPDRQLTAKEFQEYNIRSNRNLGDWDFVSLDANFNKVDLLEWGWDESELGRGLDRERLKQGKGTGQERIDKLKKMNEKWNIQIGQTITLGNHKIICGDSTEDATYKKLLKDEKADVIITDPPYGVAYRSVTKSTGHLPIINDNLKGSELIDFIKRFIELSYNHSTDNAVYYIFHAMKTRRHFELAIDTSNLTELSYIIWNKIGASYSFDNYRYQYEPIFYCKKAGQDSIWFNESRDANVITINANPTPGTQTYDFSNYGLVINDNLFISSKIPKLKTIKKLNLQTGTTITILNDKSTNLFNIRNDDQSLYLHPTQKPVEIAERILYNSSKIDDIVLDPFGGSGFVLIGCEILKRRARIIELEPMYCAAMIERYIELTGDKKIIIK
jgi:DNA modification methylase